MNRRNAVKQILIEIGELTLPPIVFIVVIAGWFTINYYVMDYFLGAESVFPPAFGLKFIPMVVSMVSMIVELLIFLCIWEIRCRYVELRHQGEGNKK